MSKPSDTLEHARLLGVFYYIWGGLSILGGLFFGGALILMAIALDSPEARRGMAHDGVEPELMFTIFVVMGVVGLLLSVVFGLLDLKVGSIYRQGRTTALCTVMAAINCLSVPFGTALGVFSFIISGRLKELPPADAAPPRPADDLR